VKRFLSAFALFGFGALAACGGSGSEVSVASGGEAPSVTASSDTTATTESASTTHRHGHDVDGAERNRLFIESNLDAMSVEQFGQEFFPPRR
jgi:hypothetical protein